MCVLPPADAGFPWHTFTRTLHLPHWSQDGAWKHLEGTHQVHGPLNANKSRVSPPSSQLLLTALKPLGTTVKSGSEQLRAVKSSLKLTTALTWLGILSVKSQNQ